MKRKLFTIFSLFIAVLAFSQGFIKDTQNALDCLKTGDVSNAIILLEKASAVNDLYAQFYLGLCYEQGIGYEKNKVMAFKTFRRCAERGLPDAMLKLVSYYSQGEVVPVNQQKKEEWKQRYIKKGNKNVLPDFLAMYQQGLEALNNNAYAGADKTYNNFIVSEATNRNRASSPSTATPNVAYGDNNKASQDNLTKQIASEEISLSKIDLEIPLRNVGNDNSFAVIICNEQYQEVDDVPHAINDGNVFAEYCKKTLGIPALNIHLVPNATLNNIKREISWLKGVLEAYKGDANLIFFYAGHGVPDESTKSAFLLPIDGIGNDSSTGYALSELYKTLGDLPAKQMVVFLDACFSGSQRNMGMITAARGVAIAPKKEKPNGNLIVFSATEGDQTAYPDNENHHGLFTYYLLKALQESKGEMTLGQLAEYINENVARRSIVINGKSQTPTVAISPTLKNWESLRLIPD